MSYTQDDLDAIRDAISSGALEVEVDGHKTKYRSISELERAERKIINALAAGNADAPRSRPVYGVRVNVSKGV